VAKTKVKTHVSVSLRMPIELKEALDGYVSEYELNSMSEAIIAILVEKLNPPIPGLCWPCNYQNPIDAKYCCRCGKKLELKK
jgi:ribosomal protein L40E